MISFSDNDSKGKKILYEEDIVDFLEISNSNISNTTHKYIKFTNGLIIQCGKQTISKSISGGQYSDGDAITFNTNAAFSAAPFVLLTAIGGNQMNLTAPDVTKSGFTPRYRNVNTNITANATGCYWFAIGK